MTKREFLSYTVYFALTLLVLSTHWYWSFSLRSYVEPAVDPVYDVYRTATGAVSRSVRYLESRSELTEELRRLRKQNTQLKKEVYKGRAALRENEQLRKFLDLPPLPEQGMTPVEILQRNLSGWERTLRVNRGSEDGLRSDQIALQVIGDTWVIRGRVLSTSEDHSVIVLSSDPRFKIGVQIRGVPGRQFVARGWGYRGMRIRNFPSFLEIDPSSPVYTASGSTLTPTKLLLGDVSSVSRSQGEAKIGRQVQIAPPEFQSESILWVVTNDE